MTLESCDYLIAALSNLLLRPRFAVPTSRIIEKFPLRPRKSLALCTGPVSPWSLWRPRTTYISGAHHLTPKQDSYISVEHKVPVFVVAKALLKSERNVLSRH